MSEPHVPCVSEPEAWADGPVAMTGFTFKFDNDAQINLVFPLPPDGQKINAALDYLYLAMEQLDPVDDYQGA